MFYGILVAGYQEKLIAGLYVDYFITRYDEHLDQFALLYQIINAPKWKARGLGAKELSWSCLQ